MSKVNNRNTGTICEICKDTSNVSIVDFEQVNANFEKSKVKCKPELPFASSRISFTCKLNVAVNAHNKLYAASRRLGSLLPRFINAYERFTTKCISA